MNKRGGYKEVKMLAQSHKAGTEAGKLSVMAPTTNVSRFVRSMADLCHKYTELPL